MLDLIRRCFKAGRKPVPTDEDHILDLERQIQSLRLDLQERESLIAALRTELEQHRRSEQARVEELVQTATERLLSEAAAPAVQLLTQAHLLEHEGKPVAARDILNVARRLVRVIENHGLSVEGGIGEPVAFDPDRHQVLGGEGFPAAGQSVVVRIPGAAYQGRILYKAGVEVTET